MTDLSPAAQAVLDAAETGLDGYIELLPPTWKSSVAAALRAVADQVVSEDDDMPINLAHRVRWDARQSVRYQLLAIAAELENV